MSVTVNSFVPKAIKGVSKGTEKGMLETVVRVTAQAKALAPVALKNGGLLRGSIQWKGKDQSGGREQGDALKERIKDSEYVVGSPVEYAVYQEYGTRKMSSQPFLRPAVDIEANGMSAVSAMIKAQYDSVLPYLAREKMFG